MTNGADFHGDIIVPKGELLGGGLSGIVELLPNGHVVKSPWPGEHGGDSRRDLRTEALVYQRLVNKFGDHDRFIKFVAFNPDHHTLAMEYMANGTLRDYLRAQYADITPQQRRSWIRAMAEGLQVLHALGVVHCDLTPRNLLLDAQFHLRDADFGCSSVDGSATMAAASARFYPPQPSWSSPVTVSDGLFALASCIYEILTGAASFEGMPSPQMRVLVGLQQCPGLTGLECASIMRDCWLRQAQSAAAVYSRIVAAFE